MKLAALIAAKDILETVRDRLGFIFILLMPLAFTTFFGLLLGGQADRLPLAVWNADAGGEAAGELVASLRRSSVIDVVDKEGGALEQWIADDRAAAGLIIPRGYSEAVAAGRPAELTIVATEGAGGAATVASEVRSRAGEQAAVGLAARAAAGAIWSTRSVPRRARDAVIAEEATRARPVAAETLARPVATIKIVEAGAAAGQTPSGFVLSSPGMMVNFVLFSLMTAGVVLITERQNGTLQRLMTTRLRRRELIAGKVAGMFALTFVQQVLLMGVAQVFFGVDYLRGPVALLLMMIALSLIASTLGMLLAAVLRSEQALIATTVLVSMAVAALSGAWFPLEITGEGFQAVGHILPTAWVLDGLRGIVMRGFGVGDVLPALWASILWSSGFFALAVWRFRLSE
jgi:ABC-2 type transport system permease protein